ncbi:MAG: DNA primase noncatalytic subunit PriX [Candidatus Micrarchaeota archaeon]|nr:DNA primase noncatalytic subunit PriX [Candidatus Micrarchaeota archaeon]
MQFDEAKLDFAYRYPFSSEAKEIIASLESSKVEEKYLKAGMIRVGQAFADSEIPFTKTTVADMRLVYLVSYVYARMLVSAVGNSPVTTYLVNKYAIAEAKRCSEALAADTIQNMERLGKEIGINFTVKGDTFELPFYEYVNVEPKSNKEYALINQQLEKGIVYLTKKRMARIFEEAIKRSILKGLPIDLKYLPPEIIESSTKLKIPKPKINPNALRGGPSTDWIEKLLEIPLPDFRHRAVNLILAPYFANVKNLDVDQAVAAIMEYINKCKGLNPQTDITDSYVRYQVSYAKKKGTKPYSLERAKSLIGNAIDFGAVEKKEEKK